MWLTPSSIARRSTEMDRSRSPGAPRPKTAPPVRRIAPKPSRLTLRSPSCQVPAAAAVTVTAGGLAAADQRGQEEQGEHDQDDGHHAVAVPRPAEARNPALVHLEVGVGAACGAEIPADEDPDDAGDERQPSRAARRH